MLVYILNQQQELKVFKRTAFSPPLSGPLFFLKHVYNHIMINKKIKLNSNDSYITTYIPSVYNSFSKNKKWPVLVICPGGGYEHLSDREAEPVALKMNSLGFACVVLTYTLAPMKGYAALDDLKAAVSYLRTHSDELNLDSRKIIAGGFSAGGHLAASLACFGKDPLFRPDYLLLCYPVITADRNFCHEGSIINICGTDGKVSREDVSLENHVSPDFPPVFMWHTADDEAVPAENSLMFAAALKKAGVDFEYHLFSHGRHGLALAGELTSDAEGSCIQKECAVWPELFAAWAKNHGII